MTDPIPEIEYRHKTKQVVYFYDDITTLLAEVKRLRAVLVGLGYAPNRFPVVGKEVEGGE